MPDRDTYVIGVANYSCARPWTRGQAQRDRRRQSATAVGVAFDFCFSGVKKSEDAG